MARARAAARPLPHDLSHDKPWPGGAVASKAPVLRQIYLKPGELLVTHEASQISTVLGSCVAVTMFHPRLRLAAICHGMLPRPHVEFTEEDHLQRFKYLSEAIPFMVNHFQSLGLELGEMEVKLFGGANVLGFEHNHHSKKLVGSVNVEIAREMLSGSSMAINASSVGGDFGRKILFNTHTGEVLHRFL